jgi:hypothetical protein
MLLAPLVMVLHLDACWPMPVGNGAFLSPEFHLQKAKIHQPFMEIRVASSEPAPHWRAHQEAAL